MLTEPQKENVRRVLKTMHKWMGQDQAREEFIFRACEGLRSHDSIEGLGSYNSIAEKIEELGDKQKLLEPYAAFRTVFDEVFGEEEINDNAATRELVAQNMISRDLPVTAEAARLAVAELLYQGAIQFTSEKQTRMAEATADHEKAERQAQESERMISEIVAYMLDASGRPKPEYHVAYRQKLAALKALTFDQLKSRYDYVVQQRSLRTAPVEDLRAAVKTDASRQRQALYQRYEPIPDLYFPPGKSEGLQWSFGLFRRLPTSEQRRLLEHFGDAQISAACRQGR